MPCSCIFSLDILGGSATCVFAIYVRVRMLVHHDIGWVG